METGKYNRATDILNKHLEEKTERQKPLRKRIREAWGLGQSELKEKLGELTREELCDLAIDWTTGVYQ